MGSSWEDLPWKCIDNQNTYILLIMIITFIQKQYFYLMNIYEKGSLWEFVNFHISNILVNLWGIFDFKKMPKQHFRHW